MERALGNERTATLPGKARTAFTMAALVFLSVFATTEAASPAAARPADATPVIPIPMSNNLAPAEIVNSIPVPQPKITVLKRIKSGLASWYGTFFDGRLTASGRRFDMNELTAAHRTLPFGSKVKVTDLRNQRSVVVTITDRGILTPNRVIDLSVGAARELHMLKMGVDPVRLELLSVQN